MTTTKRLVAQFLVLTVAFVFALSVNYLHAWTSPPASPPNSNVSAPINEGSTAQTKNGILGANALAVFGDAILSGTNNYLNFGSTAGSSGYGFRNNNGTVEYKNSGGSWGGVGGVAGGGAGTIVSTSVTTNLCGQGKSTTVSCPAGYTVSGCSYQITFFGGGTAGSPDAARPSGNGCLLVLGGATKSSCFDLYATCIKIQ